MDRLPSTYKNPRLASAGTLLTILLCATAVAQAQDAPPPVAPAPTTTTVAPAAEAPPVPVSAEPTPVTATPVEIPVVTSEPIVAPAPMEEPVDEAAAPESKPLSIGAWAHLATFAGPKYHALDANPSKIERVGAQGEIDLLFSADLIEHFGVTANLVGEYGDNTHGGNISILDLHGKIAVDDAFNVWVGRMLVPSDRSNFSGFWFAAPWTYPGFYTHDAPPTGPRQGPYGRNDGLTVWGQAGGGMFKYYASAFDLHNSKGSALFSGRLNISLINPEPGYYHSSTYYGGKDIFAIGLGGQYAKNGSSTAAEEDDYAEFNADVLFEKNLGEGGVIDLEGAFYKYMGAAEPVDMSFFVLASWMTAEKIGWGKIQPLVRLQMRKLTDPPAPVPSPDMEMIFDAQLGYVVDNYATRFALVWQHIKTGTSPADVSVNTITLGLQLQK